MAGEVGFERLAVALDKLSAAIPSQPKVDAAPALSTSDAEVRRLLEHLFVTSIEIRDELRILNARSST